MREIKFRGKRSDNGEWVIAEMYQRCKDLFAEGFLCFVGSHAVDPKTVGQYTGLKDKNGKEIYEGDIIDHIYRSKEEIKTKRYIVLYDTGCYQCKEYHGNVSTPVGYYTTLARGNCLNIIGNIYENPELLEVKT